MAVDEFVVSYHASAADRWGQTSAGLRVYWSPGNLTQHNDNKSFSASRTNATSEYHYQVLEAERVTRLPGDFSYIVDVSWQTTAERLPYSEQMSIGGYNTVRGYDERLTIGDQGFTIRNEIRTPEFPLAHYGHGGTAGIQLLGFFDYGSIKVNHFQPGDTPPNSTYLSSVGPGVRFEISKHFSARADYGFQLHRDQVLITQPGASKARGRGHFALDLAF